MANRRMFSKDVVETDKFLNMPLTTQALYFHLGMEADDDGFIASPKKIQRSIGCAEGDLKILVSCGYLIPFESGVMVLTHWKQNNYIQADRYRKTIYQDEAALLKNEGYVYSLDTDCIQPVSIGKDRLGKDRLELGKDRIELGYNNIYSSELSPVYNMDTEKKEPEKEKAPEVEPVPSGYKIILLDKSFYEIPLEKLNFWKESYPAVDVEQEIRSMAAWADANPIKRKTRKGIVRFITNWLSREQDKGGRYQKGNSYQKGEPFDVSDYIQQQINGGNADDNTGTGF